MTATIKPPDKVAAERRALRLSLMEILGFSDFSSTWSEAPTPSLDVPRRGRHEATVADLQPQEFGGRLTGGNVRWGLVVTLVISFMGFSGLALWLYQRPVAEERASLDLLDTSAAELEAAMPTLEQANLNLLDAGTSDGNPGLFAVESAARALFEASGELAEGQTDYRLAAAQASRATLDGVRLATASSSYRAAVVPMLRVPAFETDRELIALDEAARQFGDWQLAFDDVRSALPDGVLPAVSEQLDLLSGDLASILGKYVDALRADDETGAQVVLADLDDRLTLIENQLDDTIAEVQARIDGRIGEAHEALDRILDN